MSTQQISIPENDPVVIPAKRAIIDQILEENREREPAQESARPATVLYTTEFHPVP